MPTIRFRLSRFFTLIGAMALLLALSTVLPAAAQDSAANDALKVSFPPLSGEYAVGRTMHTVTDPSRDERFTEDPSDKRALPVIFYYPAEPAADAQPSPYATDAKIEGFTEVLHIPPILAHAFQPNLYADPPAKPAESGYPVLLFMPGLGTPTQLYSSLLEQIASHGYVVVVVDPAYSSSISFYPDGHYVTAVAAGTDVSTDETSEALIETWVSDARFVLTWLDEVNTSNDILAGVLDLAHVGMFGHSFGGAASLQAAHEDARIAAAIDMDGSLFGSVKTEGLDKPLMIMNSEGSMSMSSADVSDAELEQAGITREELEAAIADMFTSQSTWCKRRLTATR